ncbi:MAG: hypothetical protein ACYDCI_11955 [Candidatus Limnocylindrales bacterium]
MAAQRAPIASRALVPRPSHPACFGARNSGARLVPGNGGGIPSPGTAEHPTLGLIGPGLRPASVAIYRRDVSDFLAWWDRPPEDATPADIARYLALRATSPASADRRRANLAHFYRAGIAAGAWSGDPTVGIARARRGAWR